MWLARWKYGEGRLRKREKGGFEKLYGLGGGDRGVARHLDCRVFCRGERIARAVFCRVYAKIGEIVYGKQFLEKLFRYPLARACGVWGIFDFGGVFCRRRISAAFIRAFFCSDRVRDAVFAYACRAVDRPRVGGCGKSARRRGVFIAFPNAVRGIFGGARGGGRRVARNEPRVSRTFEKENIRKLNIFQ